MSEGTEFTKFERARIIGTRANQISEGAPLLLKLSDAELAALKYDPVAIAKKEFEAGLVNLDVVRSLPPYSESISSSKEEE
jgi:DNA-directed RNA polymerase subunit K/omega